jgi:XTP/dITP diphosphohydrolase
MRKKIIFATTNEGKMKEIRMILQDLDMDVFSMKDAGINIDIVEDGITFEENAIIKAKSIMELSGEIVLADDSGLEVDAMNKEPGIYSARFMGENTSYDVKNQFIIDQLKGLPIEDRSARFVCAIACALPNNEIFTTRATIEGYIGYDMKGANGFGYDPIFMVPEFNCSSAELTPEQKNKISHRGKALVDMKDLLRNRGIQ